MGKDIVMDSTMAASPLHVFIDTNELLDIYSSPNFQFFSLAFSKLKLLSQIHEVFGFKVYASELVVKELAANIYPSITKKIKANNALVAELNQLAPSENLLGSLPLISRDELQTQVNDALTKAAIEIIPCSILEKDNLQTMIDDAAFYQPPFEHGNEKGFKDECILTSYSSFISKHHFSKSTNFCLTHDKQMQKAINERPCFSFLQPIDDIQYFLREKTDAEASPFVSAISNFLLGQDNVLFLKSLKELLGNGCDNALDDLDELKVQYTLGTVCIGENRKTGKGLLSFRFSFQGHGQISFFDSYEDPHVTTTIGTVAGKGAVTFGMQHQGQFVTIAKDTFMFGSNTEIDPSTIRVDEEYYSQQAEDLLFEEKQDFLAEAKGK